MRKVPGAQKEAEIDAGVALQIVRGLWLGMSLEIRRQRQHADQGC
jgi:hypothetical protein